MVTPVNAQDTPAGVEPVRIELLVKRAGEYRIVTDSNPPKTPALKTEPVLHWSNPLRGTVSGACFVWVADGRPEVIGSFYRYKVQGETVEDHEFQSLATTPLTATVDGKVVWNPPTPGLTLKPIPDAPAPAATANERLRQMRSLAREFHAFFDLEQDRTELRLLPKPLYRYEVSGADLVDGALFGFVQTTDPEVLLVVEARTVDGQGVWHYGLARMSMVNLRAEHKGRQVWQAGWDNDVAFPGKPYVILPAVRPGR